MWKTSGVLCNGVHALTHFLERRRGLLYTFFACFAVVIPAGWRQGTSTRQACGRCPALLSAQPFWCFKGTKPTKIVTIAVSAAQSNQPRLHMPIIRRRKLHTKYKELYETQKLLPAARSSWAVDTIAPVVFLVAFRGFQRG